MMPMNLSFKKEQKKVLITFSLIEAAGSYIFATIQTLLIFYLIDELHLSHAISAELVGTIIGMLCLSSLLGGYIGEYLLNYYVTMLLGTLVLSLGCLIMVLANSENTLFIALTLISISAGLIRPNTSSFIGKFYDQTQARESQRDFGFNVLYVAVNAGSTLATFSAFYLRNKYGFNDTFFVLLFVASASSLMMILGFYFLKKYQSHRGITLKSFFYTLILLIVFVLFVFYILKNPLFADIVFIVTTIFCVVTLLLSARSGQMHRAIAFFIFFALGILYFCVYSQLFISLLLFIHYCVNHQVFGFELNTSQFITSECFFILCLGFFMGKIWIFFENKKKSVLDIDKFKLSFLLIGIMYALIYGAIALSAPAEKIPGWIIILSFFFMAVSELSLMPIGYSMITKIAPKGYVSLYMGIWVVTIGIGSKLAGEISSFIKINKDVVSSKQTMSHGLLGLIILSVLGIVFCFLMRKMTTPRVS